MKVAYFFKKRKRIIETAVQSAGDSLIPLSQKQIAFRKKHPNASYDEIWNEKINPPISVEAHKKQRILELSDISIEIGRRLVPEHQFRNALSGVYTEETTPKKSEILEKLERTGSELRNEFHRVSALIETATTIEEVDSFFAAHNFLNIS